MFAVLAGHQDDPGPSALALRLMGAVHRLVLSGRAPELAKHYPSVGGRPHLPTLWEDALPALTEHADLLRHRVQATVVQTNEPGRSAPLYGLFVQLGILPAPGGEATPRATPAG